MHETAHNCDADLLANYVRNGDERAFATLVNLHQRMVIGAAWRRTGDSELARDIAQEVFATLSRKASWLAGRSTIAGWLYTTTAHLASRARRSETARRLREKRFSEGASAAANGADWQLLEDALCELPAADREAVVLHFLEDRSYEEMARTLGLSEVAARKRVSRALKSLGIRLRRRGFTSAAASLLTGAVAAQSSVSASVSASGALSLAASGGASSTFVAISTTMSHTITKIAAAATLALAAPIAWQTHANLERRAELAAIRVTAGSTSESRTNDNVDLQRELDLVTARYRDVRSMREKTEGEVAAVRRQIDQVQEEVLVSLGKSEDIARKVAARIEPMMRLEAAKAELKKNPNDPRIAELAKEFGKSMPDLMALGTQIALLEEEPTQYARFNSTLYGEVLNLDPATRARLESIFLPAFEQLQRDGLTIRNRPQQKAEDWLRRRNDFEQTLTREVKEVLPPAAKQHPLFAMGDGDPPVLFTSEKAFGGMFPSFGGGSTMSLKAKTPTSQPPSQQP
jgi:RNA polymerase sigma factor (sigma-70 family)